MEWKLVREVGSDLLTLRVSGSDLVGGQELTLPLRDWIRVAEAVTDLGRPEPPSSWFTDGTGLG